MNTATKQYTIGGQVFELKSLTWKQLKLANPTETFIRRKYIEIDQKKTSNAPLAEVVALSISIDELMVQDDFISFLLAILTPAGKEWTEQAMDDYRDVMMKIDEETIQQALADFFLRNNRSSEK